MNGKRTEEHVSLGWGQTAEGGGASDHLDIGSREAGGVPGTILSRSVGTALHSSPGWLLSGGKSSRAYQRKGLISF